MTIQYEDLEGRVGFKEFVPTKPKKIPLLRYYITYQSKVVLGGPGRIKLDILFDFGIQSKINVKRVTPPHELFGFSIDYELDVIDIDTLAMDKLSALALTTIGISEPQRQAQIPKHVYDIGSLLKQVDPPIITRMATIYPAIVNHENSFREGGSRFDLQSITDDIPNSLQSLFRVDSYSLAERYSSMHSNFVYQLLPTVNSTGYKPTDHINDIQTIRLLGTHLRLLVRNQVTPSDVGQAFGAELTKLKEFGGMDKRDRVATANLLLESMPTVADKKYAKSRPLEQIYLHRRIGEMQNKVT